MREYPELVTAEPAPDDQEVLGKAWPRVQEWRELKKAHPGRGRSLSWLEREDRIRTLEVTLLTEHGMTLPPETYPVRGLARDSQLRGAGRPCTPPGNAGPGVRCSVGCAGY